MKKLFFLLLIVCSYKLHAQPGNSVATDIKIDTANIFTKTAAKALTTAADNGIDTANMSFKLDLLRAPASPASNLLGFAVSDIDKPTDVSEFMVSLQSATSSFIKLPSNYAIDIAPFLLFANDDAGSDTKKLTTKNNIIKQTLVLSLAYKSPDEDETVLNPTSSYGGIGFKVSFLRGHYNSKTIRGFNKINAVKLKATQDDELKVTAEQQKIMDNDPELKLLEEERRNFIKNATPEVKNAIASGDKTNEKYNEIQNKIDRLYKQLATEKAQIKYGTELKEAASTFQVERIGWSLDLAGGLSGEFLNKKFDDSRVHNAGAWLSGGYTGKTGVSFLGLAKFLHNPDQVVPKDSVTEFANTTNWDAGGRLIYSKPQSKFSASVEYISRWTSADAVGRTWRFVFNADYAIWENQKLTFSFGRNFDGTITKDGNLVAALSFLTGFGNRRK